MKTRESEKAKDKFKNISWRLQSARSELSETDPWHRC